MIKRFYLSSLVCLTFLTLSQVSHAQMFFEADWLYYGRDSDSGQNIVNGPESIGLGDEDFDPTAGYRLTIGGSVAEFDIDASFMQLDTWNSSSYGTFMEPITLDGVSVPGDPMGINSLADFTSLFQAANSTDELPESERIVSYLDPVTMLDHSLTYSAFNKSNLRQFEINFGSRREVNWWRVAVGYRHINFDERNGLTLNGVFDALDVDPAMPDDPNNGLAAGSLTDTGLVGTGDFVSIDTMMMVPVDLLAYQVIGSANNELDGAQLTTAVRLFDGKWITIEGIGKAGIYRNRVSGSVQETVVGGGESLASYQRSFRDNDTKAAFAGNLGLRGTISLTDYINLIAGYDVLFLAGVAIGAEQTEGLSQDISGNTIYSVKNDGSMIAHGSNLGIEIWW